MEIRYKTTKPIVLDNGDRIHRIAMHQYPLAVCGGTSGSLYLVDLEQHEILDTVPEAHDPVGIGGGGGGQESNISDSYQKDKLEQLTRALKLKQGFFVGKGIVTITMNHNQVVTAGREGSARIWDIVDTNDGKKKLQFHCHLQEEKDTVVTSLKFDSQQRLWTGSYDGSLRVYAANKDSTRRNFYAEPSFSNDFHQGPILDISLSDEFQCGACACANGPIQIFDLETGSTLASLQIFRDGILPKSVLLLKDSEGKGNLICGGSDGSLYRHYLQLDPECTDLAQAFGNVADAECQVDMWDPLETVSSSTIRNGNGNDDYRRKQESETRLKPAHTGPIMCLESPHEGMFLSAAQDGTVKVWGCNSRNTEPMTDNSSNNNSNNQSKNKLPQCRFILKGYTPYMSNICTDGIRIISDGCRNKLNMRDFSLQLD